MIKLLHRLKCNVCLNEFTSKIKRRYFCSDECRNQYYNLRVGVSKERTQSPGMIGAIRELEVVVDLMKKNFQIFRAYSPNCPCDLIALKDGKALRVEVRTGSMGKDGKVGWPKKETDNPDMWAIVVLDEIHYFDALFKPMSTKGAKGPIEISHRISKIEHISMV